MAKSIPAIVTPEVLKWARELDKISEFEIAEKIKVDVAKIRNWEAGDEYPSLTQAKKLAKQYRVSFQYFYLPDIRKRQNAWKRLIIERSAIGRMVKCLES